MAWVALVPWLLAVSTASRLAPAGGRRAFLLGLGMSAVYFSGTLYWIPDVLVTFGGIPRWLAVPVGGLLVAYLALFPTLASWIVGRVVARHGLGALWLAVPVWVSTEWLRGWLLTGFPWVSLGYSQVRWGALAQSASLFGVWGLSGVVVAANVAIVMLVRRGRGALIGAACVIVLVAALVGWGLARQVDENGPAVVVGIVQGNVPQDEKWSPERADEIFRRYLALSRDAAARGARLIVWPESSTPFLYEEDPGRAEAIRLLARETGAWLIFGSDQIERGRPPKYYNSAFAIAPNGQTAGVYRKQHLVPFGEYVPLKKLLFFVGPLVEAVSDFSPGEDAALLPIDGRPVSVAICYEVVFGELVRAAVLSGSQLLTTITNDAWYGRSSAPWQHFEQASLRAIEEGRYLVRAANTGVSGIVDPRGRVLVQQGLFETGVLVGTVRFLSGRTLYSRIGDSFVWACVAVSLVGLWGTRESRIARTGKGERRGVVA